MVVVGPNGAGKSTLLKVLSGEIVPDSGAVLLDDRPLKSLSPAELARRRAVLPQQTDVAFPFSVAEVVGLGLLGGRAAGQRIESLLARVDLPGFAERRFDSLSGGERQRTHLARVLAQLDQGASDLPRFLLLDEPTASLDLSHQLLVLNIARAHARRGGGVFAVLHDLNLAAMVADHLLVLKQGRLLFQGTPEEVLTDRTLNEAFDVRARVNMAPDSPFILPQAVEGWAIGGLI